MSAELRRLLHTAAETGPLPDVDAILARGRRRHRRRVALSVSTSVLAAVIAVAMLWPGGPQARVTFVNPPRVCPEKADNDLFRPTFVPPGFVVGPHGWVSTEYDPDLRFQAGAGTYQRVFDPVASPAGPAKDLNRVRITLQVFLASGSPSMMLGSRVRSDPLWNDISTFDFDCGRGYVGQVPNRLGMNRIATYLIWPVAQEREAALLVEPAAPGQTVLTPAIEELLRMARSVAVR